MGLNICKRCGTESPQWTGKCASCGGTEVVSVTSGVDTFVDRTVNQRFKLIRKIGQGGMGTVYEAEDIKLGVRAAIKFLNPELARNVELARRFLSEARTYARITHPGAVGLYDFGQDHDGTLYIAMEYVEGRNLKDLLDERRRLPLGEAVDIVLQVAGVLEFAHEKGVVHRDLKPENVMVRPGLHGHHVKLLDFGVARRTYAGATQLTAVGAMAGTPRYMAPEQVRGEDVDGRVDVYALGLLLFELLSGVPAMDAPDLQGMMAQQLRGGVRSLASVDPALANVFVDMVLQRATHKDRDQRFANMRELAQALTAATQGRARGAPENSAVDVQVLPLPAGPVVPAPSTDLTYRAKATPIPLVTPAPLRSRYEPPRSNGWLKWVALALSVGLLGGALGWMRRTQGGAVVMTPPPPSKCPSLDLYEPELRDLSIAELERQVAGVPVYLPSQARKQLEVLKTQVQNYAVEQRDCMYRSMLLGSLTGARTVLQTTPGLWGHTRELGRLRSLFLEMPLKQGWSTEQRASVLSQIETLFIANLKAEDDADRDYWRRQYYGIELLCEVTDEGLRELHTQRPDSCLNLKP